MNPVYFVIALGMWGLVQALVDLLDGGAAVNTCKRCSDEIEMTPDLVVQMHARLLLALAQPEDMRRYFASVLSVIVAADQGFCAGCVSCIDRPDEITAALIEIDLELLGGVRG